MAFDASTPKALTKAKIARIAELRREIADLAADTAGDIHRAEARGEPLTGDTCRALMNVQHYLGEARDSLLGVHFLLDGKEHPEVAKTLNDWIEA